MTLPLGRILVIDDEPQLHRLMRIALKAADYTVERAETGTEGLRLIHTRAPDAVLLDLGLPDLDGQTVLTRIRTLSTVAVIVLSARTGLEEKIMALDNGADDYIEKPFDMGELLARIRAAMRRRREQKGLGEKLHFDGMELDIAKRRVTVRGEPVQLTAKEWSLLMLLSSNAGRVMTHQQLLTTIWGQAQSENRQYLRVYMASLRQKLGDAAPLIQTEAGVGYRMADLR